MGRGGSAPGSKTPHDTSRRSGAESTILRSRATTLSLLTMPIVSDACTHSPPHTPWPRGCRLYPMAYFLVHSLAVSSYFLLRGPKAQNTHTKQNEASPERNAAQTFRQTNNTTQHKTKGAKNRERLVARGSRRTDRTCTAGRCRARGGRPGWRQSAASRSRGGPGGWRNSGGAASRGGGG